MIATLLLTLPLVAQDPATPPPPPAIPADTEVVETASGLRYSVLDAGAPGVPPHMGDVVRVHYTGWLLDGTVFDSSVQRGTPAEFGLGGVIEGWNEALQLMTPGARWKLTIPPDLAYGEQGSGDIPPGATLVFEVELLDVVARSSLSFVPWSAEGATPAEGGIEVRVLEPGRTDEPVDQRTVAWVEFGLWTEAGEFLFSDLLAGRPLVTDPKRPQLAFLANVLPHATEGSLVQARVPLDQMPELMGLDKLAGETAALWQFRIRAASDLQKPEFRLPADEELTTTESGLRYVVLREGSALHPTIASTVVAHYAGWLTNGTQFDSSYDRGQPLNSPLTRLVKGWQEGIPQMGRGALVLFVVPPELGYGDREKTNIPAGSTLVFAIELIDFR